MNRYLAIADTRAVRRAAPRRLAVFSGDGVPYSVRKGLH